MNTIQSTVASIASVTTISDRWQSHNCPGCVHLGHSRPDSKKRGGLLFSSAEGGIAYSCFNCGFKATWKPGMVVSKKFKDLLTWYGATSSQIMNITMIANEIIQKGEFDESTLSKNNSLYEKFVPVELPKTAKTFSEWASESRPPAKFLKVMEAVASRNIDIINTFNLYWSPDTENELNQRFIVPFYMNDRIVGYTARHIWWGKKQMKYLNKYPTNFLYNFDILNSNTIEDILIAEGPIDAGLVGGVATNHFLLKDNQIHHLKNAKSQGKNIIVVPDRDNNGRKMVEQALQLGFSVALPEWGSYIDNDNLEKPIKDIEHCVRLYGRLTTRILIKKYTYSNEFEIRVKANQWFV